MSDTLQKNIDAAWEDRTDIGSTTVGAARSAVEEALELLDSGAARVAEPDGGAAGGSINGSRRRCC
jgi:2,3,4,5-tetrahydropyridine-2-carboxylate N-succinyltransferase